MARRTTTRRRRSKADREFVSEAEELLERMRTDVADMDEQRASGREVDPELVNRLFRSAHSLKALAGLFGFDPIQHLAHRLEDVLDGLRLGRVALDAGAASLIAESVRLFARLLERVGDATALADGEEAIGALLERIDAAVAAGAGSAADALQDLDLDPSLLRALTEYEEHRLREGLRRGRHVSLVEATFEIVAFEERLSAISESVRVASGEVISTLPSPGEASDSQIRFALIVASERSSEDLAAHLEPHGASVRCLRPGAPGAAVAAPARAPGPASEGSLDVPELESLRSISETVRVDIRKLDELMNLVGELVIQRGTIGELVTRLAGDPSTARLGAEFSKVHNALDRKLRELQSAVLDVRMVPLRQVFEKVARVVRSLRTGLGKDVELDIRGADTELDKLIAEELVDPLMHVVRNALDHAVEPPDERRAAGKPARARVGIDAFQRGNHVVIAVSDDGAGIDLAGLRAAAEEAGLVEPDAVLSDRETLDLIFSPGFSTRKNVTETSGRGVGMDVVRENLTALGGVVDVDSTPGRGTTVSMTLPITLAIVQSLIVVASGQRFAIPLNAVQETLLVLPEEIQRSEGRELLNLRGDALPLRRLAAEFALDGAGAPGRGFVVVIGLGDQRAGLFVDRLEGQQDTVLKPIQGPAPVVRGIAGATELGDQDPVLVLDVSALTEDALRRAEAA